MRVDKFSISNTNHRIPNQCNAWIFTNIRAPVGPLAFPSPTVARGQGGWGWGGQVLPSLSLWCGHVHCHHHHKGSFTNNVITFGGPESPPSCNIVIRKAVKKLFGRKCLFPWTTKTGRRTKKSSPNLLWGYRLPVTALAPSAGWVTL